MMDKRQRLPDSKASGVLTASNAPSGLHHHHSVSGQLPSQVGQAHSVAPHAAANRPNLDRANTFPTPPTSASSVMTGPGNSYDWNQSSMSSTMPSSTQPLAIDTSLSHARSLPATPAGTPPGGSSMHSMSTYGAQSQSQSYESSRSTYSAAPQPPSQYATQQQNLARFGQGSQPNPYMKHDMGPPSSRGNVVSGAESGEPSEIKQDPYGTSHGNEGMAPGTSEADHDHDGGDYSNDAGASYNGGRLSYPAYPGSSISSLQGEHAHMSANAVNGSPHQNSSGRVTPRTSVSTHTQWPSGYHTPPRSGMCNSQFTHLSTSYFHANHVAADTYPPSGYTSVNGAPSSAVSAKRDREDDDVADYNSTRPSTGGAGDELDSIKRLKTSHDGGPATGYDPQGQPINRSRSNIIQRAR